MDLLSFLVSKKAGSSTEAELFYWFIRICMLGKLHLLTQKAERFPLEQTSNKHRKEAAQQAVPDNLLSKMSDLKSV